LEVFTTRPDTLLGCSFLVVAPEHPIVANITLEALKPKMEDFVKETLRLNYIARTDPDKAMIGSHSNSFKLLCKVSALAFAHSRFAAGLNTGATVQHPITGESLPVYLANYVLYGYGTGCVMGVPAHDSRDFRFANQYKLPIKPVLSAPDNTSLPFAGDSSSVLVNSGKYDGLTAKAAFESIIKDGEKQGWAAPKTTYNVHDWLVSRQRYWGTPIPIIHCKSCGPVPVPEKDLPVELPLNDVKFQGKGSPLASTASWVNCKCPKCATTLILLNCFELTLPRLVAMALQLVRQTRWTHLSTVLGIT